MATCNVYKTPQLKTINNNSLYGIGNIEIEGGGSIAYTICTLPIFSEEGSQSVVVEGVTSENHPVLDVIVTDSSSSSEIYEAWSHIYKAESGENMITFYSDSATAIELSVQILIV